MPVLPRPLRAALLLTALAAFAASCQGGLAEQPWRPNGPASFGEAAPPPSLARRLTRDEYAFTIEDQLGITLTDAQRAELPRDLPIGGFDNTAQGQATLPEHVRAYDSLATSITEAMDLDAFLSTHAPCRDAGDASCGEGFVESAGALLFRRPVTDREATSFTALLDAVAAEGRSFEESAAAVLRGMLQSPQFLYVLVEDAPSGDDTVRDASGFEIASRLSYFLWRSAPDEALLDAARGGELSSPEQVRAQAERMLDDPRARRSTALFIVDWARLTVLPDPDGLRAELVDSTQGFYQRFVWEREAPLRTLWTEPSSVLTRALAENQGLSPAGDGLEVYDLAGVEGRMGLLTQPGILAGMTNADGGQIVARGLFLQAQLFCGEAPSPPENLDEIIETFLADIPINASDRFIAETRLMRSGCGECHGAFDPLAYGFERFDFRGTYRLVDDRGNDLATDGWIPGVLTGGEDLPYVGIEDYMGFLSESRTVQRCWVARNTQYALGSLLDDGQAAAIRQITSELEGGPGDYRQLVAALVSHEIFRQVRLDREDG